MDLTINLGTVIISAVGAILLLLINKWVKSSEEKDQHVVGALQTITERLNGHGQSIAKLDVNTSSLIQITGEHGQKISDHGESIAVLHALIEKRS